MYVHICICLFICVYNDFSLLTLLLYVSLCIYIEISKLLGTRSNFDPIRDMTHDSSIICDVSLNNWSRVWDMTHSVWHDSFNVTWLIRWDMTCSVWHHSLGATWLIQCDMTHLVWHESLNVTWLIPFDMTRALSVTWRRCPTISSVVYSHMCDITHSVWHDSFYVIWPIQYMWHDTSTWQFRALCRATCVTWLVQCDMTHYMWYDPFNTCDVTQVPDNFERSIEPHVPGKKLGPGLSVLYIYMYIYIHMYIYIYI